MRIAYLTPGWYEDGRARRCDALARLARRQDNGAMRALWELYARQWRERAEAEAHKVSLDTPPAR